MAKIWLSFEQSDFLDQPRRWTFPVSDEIETESKYSISAFLTNRIDPI
jgi:hypothetical protein